MSNKVTEKHWFILYMFVMLCCVVLCVCIYIVGWSISRMIDNSEDIDNVIATISGINSRNRYSSTSDDNYSLAVYWRECNTSSNMRTSLLLQVILYIISI